MPQTVDMNQITMNSMTVSGSNMGGTNEDPGVFCKLCCPPCAVYQAQGIVLIPCLGSCCLGCFYTMFCWDPTANKSS